MRNAAVRKTYQACTAPANFRNGMVFRHGIITSLLQRLRS